MSSTSAKRPAPDTNDHDPKRAKSKPSKDGKDASAKSDKEPKGLSPEQELQMSLLNSDPELKAHFTETVIKNRPEGVSMKSMARQFWASRAHLLRAHTIQRDQKRAQDNALAYKRTGPPKEGKVEVLMNQRQISDIFRQHPIVRQAFDDLVPTKIKDAGDFWSRFWTSYLCCAIKGQRPNPDEVKKDPELDRYLALYNATRQEAAEARRNAGSDELVSGEGVAPDEQTVPRFIDIEGNEQNHSQRKGNAPDIAMRPSDTREGIFRILNTMSEQLLAASEAANNDPSEITSRTERGNQHKPAGIDESTYNELRLRDLQAKEADDAVRLNIRDPSQIHAAGPAADQHTKASAETQAYLRIDPEKALKQLRADLSSSSFATMHLEDAIGFTENDDDDDDDDDEEEEDNGKKTTGKGTKTTTLGSHTAITAAAAQINLLLEQQQQMLSPATGDTTKPIQDALSPATAQNLSLTHHTTTEFLHYFWALLLSFPAGQPPSPAAAKELPALLASLSNSLVRIASVAADAESERAAKLTAMQKQANELMRRSEGRRRIRIDERLAGPGQSDVAALMAPTVGAIGVARARFEALDLV